MNLRANAQRQGAAPETHDVRGTMLALVHAAGFALRASNEVRVSVPGGLDAALLCLDLLQAQ